MAEYMTGKHPTKRRMNGKNKGRRVTIPKHQEI